MPPSAFIPVPSIQFRINNNNFSVPLFLFLFLLFRWKIKVKIQTLQIIHIFDRGKLIRLLLFEYIFIPFLHKFYICIPITSNKVHARFFFFLGFSFLSSFFVSFVYCIFLFPSKLKIIETYANWNSYIGFRHRRNTKGKRMDKFKKTKIKEESAMKKL